MVARALFSSATDEWATPQDLFDELDKEFGFMLDAAATAENAKCEDYYDRATDGLTQPWADFGTVYCNPPYGREIGRWVQKAYMESLRGATVVCLLPVRTDTAWWQRFVWEENGSTPRQNVEVRFIKGRLKFGGSRNSAPFPSAIVIFRPPSEVK